MDGPRTRRDFLRLAAGAAAAAATGAGCNSGSDKPKSGPAAGKAKNGRTLRIAQLAHFVPAYDQWFDDEYTKRWGEEHDVEVVVDHVTAAELQAQADGEVAAQRGHDIFGFASPPPAYEDQVIDHREIVEEVTAKLGPATPLVERSILNPKTGKYFGFGEYWTPNPVNYRIDLWGRVGSQLRPDTWEDVLRAGPALKAAGHPLGIDISEDLDGNFGLFSLMHAFGASLQDEKGNVTINRPAAVDAVKLGVDIFEAGMSDEVLNWADPAANNRHMLSGRGSLILNPISALRAVEKENPELAKQIRLAPVPSGPAGRLGTPSASGTYVIWKFSRNQELAQRFLVDLALNYREAFLRSEFYNLPAFPGAVPDLKALLASDSIAQPPDKYSILAEAAGWSTNLGHPGYTNAAVEEVFNQYLIPKMFAAAARGEMSPEEAVRAAEAQMKPIFEKWRERGKI
jgi:multiple sugar transport system substrate-binding protein